MTVYLSSETVIIFGDITGTDAGGISGRELDGTNGTVEYCYFKHASSTGVGSGAFFGTGSTSITASSSKAGNGSWDSTLNTDLQDNYNSNSDVWITSGDNFSTGFGLTTFNQSPWDVDTSYTANTSEAQFGSAGGEGDPHITTLNMETYDVVTNGCFKLFDNNSKKDRLIINAEVGRSKYPIWSDKEYIKNVFISYNDMICIISMGFRGEEARIIYNNISDMSIEEKRLRLNKDHKKFCSECKYRTRDNKLLMRHRRNSGNYLLPGVRNEFKLNLNTNDNDYKINIQNVNYDNFQPAKISIKLSKTKNLSKYTGAIVRVAEKYENDISSLTFTR